MTSLTRVAGAGKSHLAEEFARVWWEEDSDHRFVFWFTAADEYSPRMGFEEALSKLEVRELV